MEKYMITFLFEFDCFLSRCKCFLIYLVVIFVFNKIIIAIVFVVEFKKKIVLIAVALSCNKLKNKIKTIYLETGMGKKLQRVIS